VRILKKEEANQRDTSGSDEGRISVARSSKNIRKPKKSKKVKNSQQKVNSRFFDVEADEGSDSEELHDAFDKKLNHKQIGKQQLNIIFFNRG